MILRKIELYILSLWLLFLFIIVITIDIPICFGDNCQFIGFKALLGTNVIPFISLCFLLYGGFGFFRFNNGLKGTTNIPFEVKKSENINYEHLIFLATYVIPLVSFNFENSRYLLVLVFLLIVMGIIYIKTDMFYANPSLALLGFKIYKVDGSFKNNTQRDGLIIITRSNINSKDKLTYIKLDDRIYYAMRCGEWTKKS